MSAISYVYTFLFYAAAVLLVGGLVRKIYIYAKTPAPLKIPTTPAPVTRAGVVYRMFKEVVLFESLFKGNKPTWLFAFLFHFGLLLVLIRHTRYFVEHVPSLIAMSQWAGIYAGMAMVAGLLGLLARRIVVDRVRYISSPSDYLILLLLISIGLSGLGMKYVAHTDIVQVKAFFLGLLRFDWQNLPSDGVLLVHLALVAILMMIFAYSKLLHGVGIFFSPTRNQVDNARERRHIADWAKPLDKSSGQ